MPYYSKCQEYKNYGKIMKVLFFTHRPLPSHLSQSGHFTAGFGGEKSSSSDISESCSDIKMVEENDLELLE